MISKYYPLILHNLNTKEGKLLDSSFRRTNKKNGKWNWWRKTEENLLNQNGTKTRHKRFYKVVLFQNEGKLKKRKNYMKISFYSGLLCSLLSWNNTKIYTFSVIENLLIAVANEAHSWYKIQDKHWTLPIFVISQTYKSEGECCN